MTDETDIERRFDAAMFRIYDRAGAEVGYWATRYLQMLRRRGGLDTARYLLNARVTSDGYARLRDANRLDLTVESLVLEAEFEPLFTPAELARARDRLRQYRAMPTPADLVPSAELLALVELAALAPGETRIVDYRDRLAAFGSPAIVAMQHWVDDGRSVGFAVGVIETVGRADLERSLAALLGIRAKSPDWAGVTEPAITRLEGQRRTRLAPRAALRDLRPAGAERSKRTGVLDQVSASGPPPPSLGPCQFVTKAGRPCQNPGRYWIDGRLSCSRDHGI